MGTNLFTTWDAWLAIEVGGKLAMRRNLQFPTNQDLMASENAFKIL